jgi:hypothetical protein
MLVHIFLRVADRAKAVPEVCYFLWRRLTQSAPHVTFRSLYPHHPMTAWERAAAPHMVIENVNQIPHPLTPNSFVEGGGIHPIGMSSSGVEKMVDISDIGIIEGSCSLSNGIVISPPLGWPRSSIRGDQFRKIFIGRLARRSLACRRCRKEHGEAALVVDELLIR